MKIISNPFFLIGLTFWLGIHLPLASSPYLPITGSAWQLAVADVTGDGQNELIYGAYDGTIRCQDLSSGKLLWEVSQPAFPFQVKARDIDFDGQAEVFVVTAEGVLYAISPTGKLLWTFRSSLPLYDVDIGNVADGGTLEIVTGGIDKQVYVLTSEGRLLGHSVVLKAVHRLATGDLDQDGIDEIIVIDNQDTVETLKLQPEWIETWKGVPYPQTLAPWKGVPYPNWPVSLEHFWQKPLDLPRKFGSWHNPYAKFSAFSIVVEDINADGFPEIILGSSYKNEQAVLALTSQGNILWLSKGQPPMQFIGDTYTEFFSMAFVQVVELLPTSPGKEVVVVAGGMIRVLNSRGQIVQEANARMGFSDLVMDGQTAYLGSSPNGDNTVYRFAMNTP